MVCLRRLLGCRGLFVFGWKGGGWWVGLVGLGDESDRSDRSDWSDGAGRGRTDGAAGSGEGGVDFLFCFVAVFEGFVCSFEGGIRFCES